MASPRFCELTGFSVQVTDNGENGHFLYISKSGDMLKVSIFPDELSALGAFLNSFAPAKAKEVKEVKEVKATAPPAVKATTSKKK
jgi:hypothetical protein